MGLTVETISPTNETTSPASSGFSRRPILAALIGGSAVTALLWYVAMDDPNDPKKREESETLALQPDTESANEVRRRASEQHASQSGKQRIEVPAEENENVGTTDHVPPLPMDAVSPATILAHEKVQAAEHVLQLQKWQLGLRHEAFASATRVKAFEEARGAEQAEMAAMLHGLGGGGAGGGSEIEQALAPTLAAMGAARQAGAFGGGTTGHDSSSGGGDSDPNHFANKLDFFARGGQQLAPGELAMRVQHAPSAYMLRMGTEIPGVLLTAINSEAPGQITGVVSQGVLDSTRHEALLIPSGSQLVGTYNVVVGQGQSTIQIAWVRLNFPNGDTLDLGGMAGADQAGASGFRDKVNRHFGQRFAMALLTSALTVGYEATGPQNGQMMESAVHRGVGESIVQLGADIAREQGQIPPTITIRAGYRFNIHVSKDIAFEGPYEDGIDRNTLRRARRSKS